MSILVLTLLSQLTVDAGPIKVVCGGQEVTLQGSITNAPVNFTLDWDGLFGYELHVVNPAVTTEYTLTLTDLDTLLETSDTTRVLVHPGDADLNGDFFYDEQDWLLYFGEWRKPNHASDMDPDLDGQVTILDWFYFCNFTLDPPNTPPFFVTSIESVGVISNQLVVIPYEIDDLEQTPYIKIDQLPPNGTATISAGVLRYSSNAGFSGTDSFTVRAYDHFTPSEGLYSAPEIVNVTVIPPETWQDLYNDIFFPVCKACHIDANEGMLSLSSYKNAQMGGASGPGFVIGDPSSSLIYIRVSNETMPLMAPPLSFEDKERIRLWILQGAPEF